MIINQTSKNGRPYAPMSSDDVNYVYQKKKEHKVLMGVRAAALQFGYKLKAASCRIEADQIAAELQRKFDIIL